VAQAGIIHDQMSANAATDKPVAPCDRRIVLVVCYTDPIPVTVRV